MASARGLKPRITCGANMGFGDEIMATGEAVRAQRSDRRPVAVLDKHGRPRWHELWRGNPRIARPAQLHAGLDAQTIVNGPGCRPYVARYSRERWYYADWQATPGEIYLDAEERRFGRSGEGVVVIEPHIKAKASPNKNWGWRNWRRLVALRPDLPWVQLGPPGTPVVEGARYIPTANFRLALAALAAARAAVLPEGGLHHGAAALGVPAVVIFGGMVSPRNTGYAGHANLYRPHRGSPCGLRVPCRDCARVMASITPEQVAEALEGLLCSTAKA